MRFNKSCGKKTKRHHRKKKTLTTTSAGWVVSGPTLVQHSFKTVAELYLLGKFNLKRHLQTVDNPCFGGEDKWLDFCV